jgi:hypothetical protein
LKPEAAEFEAGVLSALPRLIFFMVMSVTLKQRYELRVNDESLVHAVKKLINSNILQ